MNPFANINLDINTNETIKTGIEDEIREFEERILSVKNEIDSIESLKDLYRDKEENCFLWGK